MLMKRLFLTLLTVFLSINVFAQKQRIGRQEAMEKAQLFLQQASHARRAKGVTSTPRRLIDVDPKRLLGKEVSDELYIFNVENNNGFVIVGGDERIPSVLGYSDKGALEPGNIPSNMRQWLLGYVREVEAFAKAKAMSSAPAKHNAIDPILLTDWYQTEPFNLQCPVYNGYYSVTGCVATAMAQILYHVRPDGCAALDGYTTDELGIKCDAIPATTFDWEKIKPSYEYDDVSASAQEVAKLLRYCGQSVHMDYTPTESGAVTRQVPNALKEFFGISNSCQSLSRNDYTSDAWDNLIYTELSENRPVLIGGFGPEVGGHAFVCDGYDGNGLYHINWGWGGFDGYFLLSALFPHPYEVGGAYSGFNMDCEAIVGIKPTNEGELSIIPVMFSEVSDYSSSISRADQSSDFNINIDALFFNMNEKYTDYEVCWGFYDAKGNLLKRSDAMDFVFDFRYGTTLKSTLSWGAECADGTYYLVPLSHQKGCYEWTKCLSFKDKSITIQVSGNKAVITKSVSGTHMAYQVDDIVFEGSQLPGFKQKIHMKVTNTGNYNSGVLYIFVDDKELTSIPVDIDPNETEDITMPLYLKDVGKHSLYFAYSNNRGDSFTRASETINYSIFPESTCKLDITSSVTVPNYVDQEGLFKVVHVNNRDVEVSFTIKNPNAIEYRSILGPADGYFISEDTYTWTYDPYEVTDFVVLPGETKTYKKTFKLEDGMRYMVGFLTNNDDDVLCLVDEATMFLEYDVNAANTVFVTYMVDGAEYAKVKQVVGSSIALVEPPTKEGYTFTGWTDLPETMPANDITVTGSFAINSYLLSYVIDGQVVSEESIPFGTPITFPEIPIKEGYTFAGWNGVPAIMPACDVTIESYFTVNKYMLAYIVDGEVYYETEVSYGTDIPLFDAPTKEGYTFYRWEDAPETLIMPDHAVFMTAIYAIRGDVNLDEKVNITDAVDIVNDRLGFESTGFVGVLSDVNRDDLHTIADAISVLNIMYGEPAGSLGAKRLNTQEESLALSMTDNGTLALDMNSQNAYSAFQFDVELPYGTTIEGISLNDGRCKDFAIHFNRVDNNRYRVVAYNLANRPMTSGNENLLYINIVGVDKSDEVRLINIHFSTQKAEDVAFEDMVIGMTTDVRPNYMAGSDIEYDITGSHARKNAKGMVIVKGRKFIRK